ncbi:MAG: hypothetical protein QG663_409, partial [Thermodesulfobacteriota bacterium]|nr:hypothetical protein [Thermodesulfobacteriota bacterium]
PLLGVIPIDPQIVIAGDSGRTVEKVSPEGPSALSFAELGEKVQAAIMS